MLASHLSSPPTIPSPVTGVTIRRLTAPPSLSQFIYWVALRSRCGITAVDTHIADADAELISTPLTLYHLSCIMMGVSCISPVVCARCIAL